MKFSLQPQAPGKVSGIPADKVRRVEFMLGAKFGHYLGGLVNRIEGVNASLRKPHWTRSTNE